MRPADGAGSGAAIHVRPDELTGHSVHVWSVSDEITRAEAATKSVSMNHDAFGMLIGFVGGWFQDKEQDLAEKFKQMNQDLMDDSLHLRGAASHYEFADYQAAQNANTAGSQLPRIELPL
jgi:hypothetical protein